MIRHLALWGSLAFGLMLAGCGGGPRPPAPSGPAEPRPSTSVCQGCPGCVPCPTPPVVTPPPVTTPGVPSGPPLSLKGRPLQPARWSQLPGWGEDDPVPALSAFLASCPALKEAAWRKPCAEGRMLAGADAATARRFFETNFQPYQVVNGDGSREGLVTGYYEPIIRASRSRSRAFNYPLYAPPDDLLTIDLGEQYPELKGMRLRGRLEGKRVVPYYSRAELMGPRQGVLNGKALFYAADPIELFFLQVQGSGRLQLEDGGQARVGYGDHNGYPYQSIGKYLIDRGELKAEQASMDGIKGWARANPGRVDELLNANPAYVFFRELPGNGTAGPPGTLGVPLTPGRSLAVDTKAIPLGAPVFLATTHPNAPKPLNRLMLAQDTGGAIKGAVRADFYWGTGPEAGLQAGRMKQKGQMWVLIPMGVTQ